MPKLSNKQANILRLIMRGRRMAMAKLTTPQRRLLGHLASGHHLCFSQDGDSGWTWPGRINLDAFGISDDELQQLRGRGFLRTAPEDDDESYRVGPPQIITPAGRAALESDDG